MNTETNKNQRTSFVTVLLILSVIVIISMCFYIYKLKEENYNEIEQKSENIENTIKNTQEQLGLSKNETNKNEENGFSDEEVKLVLSDYFNLMSYANCDSLLEELTTKGNLKYDPSSDTILDDGLVITKIRFVDYKNAMLNYVTENEFDKNWNSTLYFNENEDGYLTKLQGGGGLNRYFVDNITKENENTYFTEISYITEEDETFYEEYEVKVESYDKNPVIDSIKLKD